MKKLITICLFLVTVITVSAQNLKPYRSHNKFGLKDENGKVVVPYKYDYSPCLNQCPNP